MWLLLALVVGTTPAEHLRAGEAAMDTLDYDTAADELMAAAIAAEASEEEKLRANLLAGIAHRVLGRDLEARINFRYVLLRAPGTQLDPATSPRVRLFFESVRQEVQAEAMQRARLPEHEPATPPVAPPMQPAAPSPAPGLVAGGIVGAVGAATLLFGAGGIAFAEASLADPQRPGAERTSLRSVGQWSAVGAGLGALVAGAGAIVAVFSASEAP